MRIIHQDPTKIIRDCFDIQMVCFDNTNSLFISSSCKSYKEFVSFVERLGAYFGSNEAVIQNVDYDEYLISACEWYDCHSGRHYSFWHQPSGSRSEKDFIKYSKDDFQRTQKLSRKELNSSSLNSV